MREDFMFLLDDPEPRNINNRKNKSRMNQNNNEER